MTISIQCPGCGKGYQLDDSLAGKRVKCKCGQRMSVPAIAQVPELDIGRDGGLDGDLGGGLDFGLGGGLDVPDPSASLLDGSLLPLEPSASPLAPAGLAAASLTENADSPLGELHAPKPQRASKGKPSKTVILLCVAGGVMALLAGVAGITVAVIAASRPGFKSPEEAFAAHQAALTEEDWEMQFRALTPESQARALEAVAMAGVPLMRFSPELKALLFKAGLREPPSSETMPTDALDGDALDAAPSADERQSLQLAGIEDQPGFYADLILAVEEAAQAKVNNPLLKVMVRKALAAPRRAMASAQLSDVQINGDTATATATYTFEEDSIQSSVKFKQIGGRWFIDLAELYTFGHPLAGT